jgi:competence protein ComEC
VRVTLRAASEALPVGSWVRLPAVLNPPPAPAMPGAFDFARQAWFDRLGGVGYAVGRPEAIAAPVGEDGAGWRLRVEGLRQRLNERIQAALPGPAGAVAAALMTGDRGAIPEELVEAMRDSGLAHLLSISGLHIGLVWTLLFFAVRAGLALAEPVALRWPVKKWAAAAALAGAFAYLLISGAEVPTQRAFLMTALVTLAILCDRSALSMRLVAWAAGAILLLTPEALLSASFQLSFAAVVALVAAYEVLAPRLARLRADSGTARRIGLYLAGVCLTTFVAGLATAPFGLFHFTRLVN